MLINISKINLNPSGGGKPIELESKEITITENGTTTVVPSEGFGGLSSVDIDVYIANPVEEIDFGEIGYNVTDNQNVNMAIQDGIAHAKQIQAEYTDSKKYTNDTNLVYFPNVDTSNRTSCSSLFSGCGGLQYIPSLSISNKCTSMGNMFHKCGSLKSIDTTNWNTENVTDSFIRLFSNCTLLENLKGIENLNTSKCTRMDYMFEYCSSLKSLDLSNWDTSNVNYMSNMFQYCSSLESLNLSNWKFTNLYNNSYDNIIYYCSNLKYLNISGWDFTGRTYYPSSFLNYSNNLETIDVTNINFGTMKKCFDLSPYPSGYNVKNIIGLETWDTSGFNDMSGLFEESRNVTSLNLSNWDTSNVTKMSYMFNQCYKLTEIIGIENLDTSNVTTMKTMFNQCSSLTSLNLSNWDTSNVTDMSSTFNQCSNLTDLNLSGWDVSNVTNLNLAFGYIYDLTNFQAPQNINADFAISWSSNLTVDSLLSILNNLTDRTGTTSLKCSFGTTNLNKLTDEQKAIATSKNWVLS